jgi:hypothetical protein
MADRDAVLVTLTAEIPTRPGPAPVAPAGPYARLLRSQGVSAGELERIKAGLLALAGPEATA